MNKTWWVAVTVPMLSIACSPFLVPEAKTARTSLTDADEKVQVSPKRKKSAKGSGAQVAPLSSRKVGDYFVHRFSGSFRQGPLTLIERVVAEEGDQLVVDYTLKDGASDKTLRVNLDRKTERALSVAELTDDDEVKVPLSTYEAMLEQTVFAPDVNEALVDEVSRTCLIGPKELDCEVKKYRVFVGDSKATLTVTQSEDMPGRDLGGELTAVDGSVIYRAELLEAGNTPSADTSVAAK